MFANLLGLKFLDGFLELSIETDELNPDIKLEARILDTGRFVASKHVYYDFIAFTVKRIEGNLLIFHLNIEDLLQRIKFGIKNAGLIDFKIINNGKSYAINIDSKSELNNVDYTDYKLITEKGGKFKLKIEIKREKCTVNKITINDNMLTINIENGNVKNAYLVQRVYKDSSILLEDHFILLKNIGFHTYSLNLDSICQLSQYDNTTIYDFVFEINNELYSYYSFAYLNDDSLDIDTIANDQFTITPYVGKKGYLSINLTRRYHCKGYCRG